MSSNKRTYDIIAFDQIYQHIDFDQSYERLHQQMNKHLKHFSDVCDTNINEKDREAGLIVCEQYKNNKYKLNRSDYWFSPIINVKTDDRFNFTLLMERYTVEMDTFFKHIPLILNWIAHSPPMVILPGTGLAMELRNAFTKRHVMCKNRYLFRLNIELPPLKQEYCTKHEKITKIMSCIIDDPIIDTKNYTTNDWNALTMKVIDCIIPEIPTFKNLLETIQFVSHVLGYIRSTFSDMIAYAVLKKHWNTVFQQENDFDEALANVVKVKKYVLYDHPVIHLD